MKNFHSGNTLTINLRALAKNYQLILQNVKSEAECAAVVKANAYGLGVIEVAKKLSLVGCSKFFVATIDEGIELRALSLTDEIYILNGFSKGQEQYLYEYNLIPVLNYKEQAILWRNYVRKKRKRLPAVIHIDTGMNRLGMSAKEAQELFEDSITYDLKILYIMSHLVSSEDEKNPMNEEQYRQVANFTQFAGKIPVSLCNSAGVFLGEKYHFDLVRVGAAIYGLKESVKMPEMERVVGLTSTIIQIREITKEEYVGYGATCKVTPGMKLAVVPLGYADGMLHSASNKGFCYIADVKTPILGRISMDSFVVDASKVPDKELYEGAEVEIIGDNISPEDIAEFSSTINYEIFLSLSHRYRRLYLE